MIWQIVGSELLIITIGTFGAVCTCYGVKAKCRNRIRAYRFSKELSLLNDREHVDWAQALVVSRRDTH